MDRDTIIAPITAVGLGSVNVIRISGQNALEVTNKHFNKTIDKNRGNKVYFGKIKNKKINIDDVLISFFKRPHSFTGENVIEISCHGNYFITNKIIDLFLSEGVRIADPGEFSRRAFLNGKIDLIQAEAIADLIAAKNQHAVDNSSILLDGYLSKKINKIKEDLLSIASLLELQIDFSEEDIDFVSPSEIEAKIDSTLSFVEPLIKSYSENKHFNQAIRVVILGKPNVGKSSLMNCLLNQDRVIVSEKPGTTRDTIHEEFEMDGLLYRLIDTAGIRFSHDQIEQEGIVRAKKIVSSSDLVLIVLDASTKPTDTDFEILELLNQQGSKYLAIANKSDLPACKDFLLYIEQNNIDVVFVSALKETNMDTVKKQISSLVKKSVGGESIVITNKRQYNILVALRDALNRTKHNMGSTKQSEFIAFDIRAAIGFINELSGGISTEDILNNIFGHFCIGK